MSGPITPDQVTLQKSRGIPDFVYSAFNEMIVKHWNGDEATFEQADLITLMIDKAKECGLSTRDPRSEIFAKRYLEIEDVYREVGWVVVFDKPGYNESYDPTFTFKKRGRRR